MLDIIYFWLEHKQLEVAKKDNINPKQSNKDWLQDHIFTDTHEQLF